MCSRSAIILGSANIFWVFVNLDSDFFGQILSNSAFIFRYNCYFVIFYYMYT